MGVIGWAPTSVSHRAWNPLAWRTQGDHEAQAGPVRLAEVLVTEGGVGADH